MPISEKSLKAYSKNAEGALRSIEKGTYEALSRDRSMLFARRIVTLIAEIGRLGEELSDIKAKHHLWNNPA